MTALADDDCRKILLATANDPLTVSELCSECDIPMATAYRKVNRLADMALLDERIRVESDGQNSHEYLLCAERIRIRIPGHHSPEVTFECTITTGDRSRCRNPPSPTDEGRVRSDSGVSSRRRSHRMDRSEPETVTIVEPEAENLREDSKARRATDRPN